MRPSPEKNESRREFFRASARYGFLGALGAIGVVIGGRRLPGGQRCVNRFICRGCAVFQDCGLPQALSAKQAQMKG